jgi:hypothetical protein
MHSLHDFMKCPCKPKDYTADKERIGAEHWLKHHLHYALLSRAEKNNRIMMNLSFHRTIGEHEDFQWASKGHMNGLELCWKKCMPFLYGVSDSTLLRLRDLAAEQKDPVWQHANRVAKIEPIDIKDGKAGAIIQWLKTIKINFAESTPDKIIFELPPGSKASYWEDYAVDTRAQKQQEASYSYFQRVWRRVFPELKVPKEVRWVSQFCH